MLEANNLKQALERLAAGTHSEADIQALRQALQAGQIALATGERAVALGGNASDTIIVTGDSNIVFKGADAVAIRQVIAVLFPPRLHHLPADLPDFTGREQEVNELLGLLSQSKGHVAISAIGGMGGVGKSALAVHVAHRLVKHYPDAHIVVDMRGTLEQPLTPAEAMANVICAFHPEARLPDDPDQVTQFYRSVLKDKRVLILLDNAADAAQVRPLLPPSPCTLIVTSRHAIALPGLRAFNLDAMREKEARHLLQAIVGKDRATEEGLNAIAALCGRLPLALRVAGTFLAVHPDWTAGEYIRALADERERLARLKQDDLDVEAALGLSAAQLAREKPDLAARWQILSAFPTTFDRAAAAAVWAVTAEEALDGLSALVERSLLLYDAKSNRYRLHDLMRPVARNAFAYGDSEPTLEADRQRLEQAAARHAAHYTAVVCAANKLYLEGGGALMHGLKLLDLEWRNIQAGQAWAEAHVCEDDAAAALCSAYPDAGAHLLSLRQHPREQIRWLETALAAARRLKDRRAEGAHLGNLGIAYKDLGELRRSIEYYEQALDIAREISDRRREGNALGNLGTAHMILGETPHAIELYKQQLVITREIGDRRGEGSALGNLGTVHATLGETLRAIKLYKQALVIDREIGDRRGEGNALFNISLALYKLGDRTQAIAYAEAALKILEQIEDPNAAKVRKQLAEWHEQK